MEEQLKNFANFISQAKEDLNLHRQIAYELGCSQGILNILDKILNLSNELENKAEKGHLKVNYLNQVQSNLNSILGSLRYRGQNDATFINNLSEERRKQSRIDFEQATENFNRLYEQIDFNLSFFEQINFFTSNVVAIGANGSGKTTLSK